jgi:hypothetical protein
VNKAIGAIFDFLGRAWVGSVIGLLGTAVGIAGIFVGSIYYRRPRPGPRLAYCQRFTRLIGGGHPALRDEVEIHFLGKGVPRLTKTLLVVWNYGNSTVEGGD